MKKNAMILAAGYGTRLKPITNTIPKALVKINETPVLELLINRLKEFGFERIVINVHHFADQIVSFLNSNNNFGVDIIISNEAETLLDTGGGIKNAELLFDKNQPILIHNVDVITNMDINRMFDYHIKSNVLATLAVKNRQTSRSLLIDSNQTICGWKHNETGEEKIVIKKDSLSEIAFSGIQVISPDLFKFITETGAFSITDVYLRLAKSHVINTFNHDESYWLDMGRKGNLEEARSALNKINE